MSVPFRLAAFYFFYFAYVAALVAYFPLYLDSRGLDAGEIAAVLALPQLVRIFAPTFWGWLADRTGAERTIVAFACAVLAASFAALPYVNGVAAIAALIGIMSLLSAGALPLVESVTLRSLAAGGAKDAGRYGQDAGRYGQDAGRYGPIRLWGSVGFILVVLAGGAWLDLAPVTFVQQGLVVLALCALMAAAGLPACAARIIPGFEKPMATPAGSAARFLLAAGFCMSAAHGAFYTFFTLHLQREGYSGSVIGILWTLGVLAEIAVFFYLPQIFRRYALSAILVFSFACAVVRFLAMGWGAHLTAVLVLAQLLHAATFGSFHAASVAAVQRVFAPHAQGRGQTLFASISYGAGGAAGILLAGWAWQAGGAGFAFSLSAVSAAVGAYFSHRLKRAGL